MSFRGAQRRGIRMPALAFGFLAFARMTAASSPSPASVCPSTIRHVRSRHPHRQRPAAQSPWAYGGPAPPEAHRDHRSLGLGQELSRLRHALRRRPAPVHRIAFDLRQAIPGADAEAAGGPAGGAGTRGRDRAAQSDGLQSFDGGHRHRDLRLPAAALGPGGSPALPEVRRAGAPRYAAVGGGRGADARSAGPVQVAFPLPESARHSHAAIVENLRALGFVRLLGDGVEYHLDALAGHRST